jgi:GBP family porin
MQADKLNYNPHPRIFITLKEYQLNKKLIASAIGMLLAANGAFAQSAGNNSVELYGIIDLGVGHVENSLSTDGNFPASVNPVSATKTSIGNSVTGMFNGGISDSRWGVRGTEDLGGGMKAFFTLESGFDATDGALNNGTAALANNSPKASTVSANTSLDGQLFNRQAFVGISAGELGSIALGRNYAPFFDIAVAYDPVQNAQLFSPLGFSGTIGGGGGVSEDTRVDNSIKYKNTIGGVNFGALYKFGGVAGSTSAESGYTLNVGYEAGPFGIQAAYENFTDALKTGNSTVAGDISVTDYNTDAFMIAAKYTFGEATIRGGFEEYTLKTPSDSVAALGITSLYGYTIGNSTTFAQANQTTDVLWIGGDYNFTPSLNLAVGFYDQNPKQSDDYVASATSTLPKVGQADGNIYSYSALLDYHFTKRTDVYAGMMYSQYKGDNYPSSVYNSSNYIVAFGMRTKF